MANCRFITASDTLSSGETTLKGRIEALGHTVYQRRANETENMSEEATMDFVVVCENISSGDISTKYKSVAKGVLTMEPGHLDEMDMASSFVDEASETIVTLVAAGNALQAGLSDGDTTVFTSAGTMSRCTKSSQPSPQLAASAVIIAEPDDATVPDSTKYAYYFAYESGATMLNSHVAEARRVFIGFAKEADMSKWNSNAGALFDAAVTWVVGAAAGQSVTPALIDQSAAIHAPQINLQVQLSLLDQSAVPFAPDIAAGSGTYIEAAASHSGSWVDPELAFATSGDDQYAKAGPASGTISGDFGFPDVGVGDIPNGAAINEVRLVAEVALEDTDLTFGLQGLLDGSPLGSEVTKTTQTEELVTYTYPGGSVSLADLRDASTKIAARARATR